VPTVAGPRAVRALVVLLVVTAAATAGVEVVVWYYAPERGFGLAVRTGWALLRTVGWLVLLWNVRRGRAASRPLGLILAVTTVFAVGRLLVPDEGLPPVPGAVGFVVLTVLCLIDVVLLYRHPAITEHMVRHPSRLVPTRKGMEWREWTPKRPPASPWAITARVAALTYAPLVLVPCLVSAGELGQRPEYLLAVVFWFVLGLGTSFLVALTTFFLLRGNTWARRLLIWVTFAVVAVDLPLCWLLLGVDGLIRDGAPLVVAAILTLYALWRLRRGAPAESRAPERASV
jgi:hypothetical protein